MRDVALCVTNKMDQNVVIENNEPLFAYKNNSSNQSQLQVGCIFRFMLNQTGAIEFAVQWGFGGRHGTLRRSNGLCYVLFYWIVY